MAKPVSPVIPGYQDFEVVYAKDQPEYLPLPALVTDENTHTLLTRWELTDEEIGEILSSKSIYLFISTFGEPLQPLMVTATVSYGEVDEPRPVTDRLI